MGKFFVKEFKMKKIVSILSATLLATSLAACSSNEEKVVEVPATHVGQTPMAHSRPITTAEVMRGTLGRILGTWFVTTTSNQSH